ncbi:MAG: D-2-hydroxyacid dehydrogenase [Nitrospinales bacterium]
MKNICNILVYLTHPNVECWNFSLEQKDRIAISFPGIKINICLKSKEFLDSLPQAEALITWYFKPEWLELAPKLQLITTPAAGADWIALPENGPKPEIWHGGFHGSMIAESVVGAVFYFCKAFEFSREMQKNRKWERPELSKRINSLYRAHVTILGFGRIGREIGKALKPFGCQITGVKRSIDKNPEYFDTGDQLVMVDQLEKVLPETDHLIMALPGGSDTDGIFNREHFQSLPKHAYIYNIGRGNLYKESDLVEALQNLEIAGAYLDVFETEPLPETSQLWGMGNVLIQPHLSAASPQYLDLYVEEFISRLKKESF